jgi:hypothetical protein
MRLNFAVWRFSNDSQVLDQCVEVDGTSPCLGGGQAGVDGAGYCELGHSGFRCEVCPEGEYFDGSAAQCADCHTATRYSLQYAALLGGPLLAWLLLRQLLQLRLWPKLNAAFADLQAASWGTHLFAQVWLLVGFAQVASAASTYSVDVPRTLRVLLDVLSWLRLDIWGEPFLPHACAGGYLVYLLLTACFPLALIACIGGGCVVRRLWRHSGSAQAAALHGLLDALGPSLAIVTILCPTVSAAAFGALHCREVLGNSNEYRPFLWSYPEFSCDSPEAARLRAAALAVLVVWPVGSLIGLAALLRHIQGSLTRRVPSGLFRASKMLWTEYRLSRCGWFLAEHFRRLMLTGVLVLIPERMAFIRCIVALFFCLGFLVLEPMLQPYARRDMAALSMTEQVVTFVLILGYSFIYLFERLRLFLPAVAGGDAIANGNSTEAVDGAIPISLVLSFTSTEQIAVLMVVLVSALVVAVLVVVLWQWIYGRRDRDFVLKETMLPPLLTMHKAHRFHLFLSHVWSTGQDQAAAIKRQIQLHLPSSGSNCVRIFLDVDDLDDTGALERHVLESSVVLVFLSRGYFTSTRTLRELRAAMDAEKPIIVVLEGDVTKGGYASLEQAIADCPAEYRQYVFCEPNGMTREIIAWHRVKEFQLCTLKLIAGAMLSHTPQYSESVRKSDTATPRRVINERVEQAASLEPGATQAVSRRVELCQLNEVSFGRLYFPAAIPSLYASPNNPGAEAVVRDLAGGFRPGLRPAVQCTAPSILRRGLLQRNDSRLNLHAPRMRARAGQFFVLYLNSDTWLGDAGAALAEEVRVARRTGMRIVMLHENDPKRGGCAFARFFQTTPGDLIDAGLFDRLAVAMHAREYRQVSMLMAAKAIGASVAWSSSNVKARSVLYGIHSRVSLRQKGRGSVGDGQNSMQAVAEGGESGKGLASTHISTAEAGAVSDDAAGNDAAGATTAKAGRTGHSSSKPKSAKGRSTLRGLIFGSAFFQTSARWAWSSADTGPRPQPVQPLLQLARPPAALVVRERVLFPRARRLEEFLTEQQPLTYRDDLIEFVNLDAVRQSVISCECTRQVQLSLLKTQQAVITRDVALLVAEPTSGPKFESWSVVAINHSLPRQGRGVLRNASNQGLVNAPSLGQADLLQLNALEGAVSGPGILMRLAANAVPESGFEAGYGARLMVNISQQDAAGDDSDVEVEVSIAVLATVAPDQTVWGNVNPDLWCSETNGTEASFVAQQRLGGGPMRVLFGATTNVSFTACDVEGLPCAHSVPTERDELPDPRSFTAELRNDTTGDPLPVTVDSPAGARYVAVVQPSRVGIFALELYLGTGPFSRQRATPQAGPLLVEVVCPPGLVVDPLTFECTCDRGYRPVIPGGAQVLVSGCEACPAGSSKPQLGDNECLLCDKGSVQPNIASESCISCLPRSHQPKRGGTACDLCPRFTNSTQPFSECELCEAGRYRTSEEVPANDESCRPCPAGASCPYGSTTLPTVTLNSGRWRISDRARTFELCRQSNGNVTACVGGPSVGQDGDGYCAPNHTGPLCELCVEEDHYFDGRAASCARCPATTWYVLVYSLLLGIPVLLFGAAVVTCRRSLQARNALTYAHSLWDEYNVDAKLKVLIGFAQIVAVIGPVYSLTMPNLYSAVLQALELVYFDLFGSLFIPTTCMGGLYSYLILKAVLPLALLAIAAAVQAYWCLRRASQTDDPGEPWWRSAPRSVWLYVRRVGIGLLPLTLWVCIFFSVSVSSSVFSALHCRRFVTDSDAQTYRAFVMQSLDIECPTVHHSASAAFGRLLRLAIVLIMVWPVGCLVGLAILLWAIHRQVLARRPSKLSHAARLLTRDYRPDFFWWDWAELLRRLVLTGFVLAVPETKAFLRLVTALLFSVLFLVAQTTLRPIKEDSMQAFSAGLQTVTIVLLTGATFMYAYQQFDVVLANSVAAVRWQDDRLAALASVFVFDSIEDFAALCLAVMSLLLLTLILLMIRIAFTVSNLHLLKLSRTRAPPMLSIRKEHRHHLFLSHVWSTGQDQVAVIKRQLLRMVLGLRIFLDVDDLEDIGAIEKYVGESMIILVFLSRGYFNSRNCLREITAAMLHDKPLLLVLEPNEAKGGLTLEEARQECPDKLREYVFGPGGGGRGVILWHRVTVFQLCTLKEIVREVLLHTPLYASEPNLSVYLDSDVDIDMLSFRQPLLLYASPNNPGCAAAAEELIMHFSEAELAVVQHAPDGMLGDAKLGRLSTDTGIAVIGPVDAGDIDPKMPRESVEEDGTAVAAGEPRSSRTSHQESSKAPAGRSAGPSRLLPDNAIRRSSGATVSARLSQRAWQRRSSEQVELSSRQKVFLLYLNSKTFVGEMGLALALEVGRALEREANIVLLHENDRQKDGCGFAHIFSATPPELINAGLYEPIALGLYPAPHRNVSFAHVAQALGARKKSRIGRPSSSSRNTAVSRVTRQASGSEGEGSWVSRVAASFGRRSGLRAVSGAAPPEQAASGQAQDVKPVRNRMTRVPI